jgi:hypothetical protein
VRDNELGTLAQVIALLTDVTINRQHVESFLPPVGNICIIKIYLQGRFIYMFRPPCSTLPVRYSDLPWHRKEYHSSMRLIERKTEYIVGMQPYGVRVKFGKGVRH